MLEDHAPADYAFSLDGNEQFRDAGAFRTTGTRADARTPELRRFFAHLLFVEQPFHRDVALRGPAVGGLKDWADRPPMIIDESDGDLHSLPQALASRLRRHQPQELQGRLQGHPERLPARAPAGTVRPIGRTS